jgi:hypothetical protein
MAEVSFRERRDGFIRLVKKQMVRPEFANSPSATLAFNFYLNMLNVSENENYFNFDESAITSGGTFKLEIMLENDPWSDDGTPQDIRKNLLWLLDRTIEKVGPKARILFIFCRNALHIAQEKGCIQVDVVEEEENKYVVTVKIDFALVEPEPIPLTREVKA